MDETDLMDEGSSRQAALREECLRKLHIQTLSALRGFVCRDHQTLRLDRRHESCARLSGKEKDPPVIGKIEHAAVENELTHAFVDICSRGAGLDFHQNSGWPADDDAVNFVTGLVLLIMGWPALPRTSSMMSSS